MTQKNLIALKIVLNGDTNYLLENNQQIIIDAITYIIDLLTI